MKRRLFSLLLLGAMLFTMLPAAFAADSETENAETDAIPQGVQVQFLTDAKFRGGNSGGYVPLSVGGSKYYAFWSPDNAHIALLNSYGETLLPAEFSLCCTVTDELVALARGNRYALFWGKTQLTSYVYETVEKDGMYARATRADGSLDFYYLNGKLVSKPRVPSGWELYDLVGDEAAIIRRLTDNRVIDGVWQYEYTLCDWNGTILRNPTTNKVEKLYFTESFVKFGQRGYVDLNGEIILDKVVKNVTTSPSGEKYLFASYAQEGTDFDVFDSSLNVLCSFSGNTAEFLTDDILLTKALNGEYVFIDCSGKELLRTKGDSIGRDGREEPCVGKPDEWGFFIQNGSKHTLYNLQLQPVLTLADLSGAAIIDEYFVAYNNDGSRSFYGQDGSLLFSKEGVGTFLCMDGVLVEEKDDHYAVCDRNGNPITDYIYNKPMETHGYGLLSAKCVEDGKYYLLNAAGKELNGSGLDRWIDFDMGTSTLACYQIGGKEGILRYVGPNDPQYLDAPASAWYYDAVEYCAEKGLVNGTAPGRFDPESTMTRAMLVTVLWRLEGKPATDGGGTFTDVDSGTWYTGAVSWASEEGIVNGVGKGRFDPEGSVTREQIATIMLRYAESKGYNTDKRAELSKFPDAAKVSTYAAEAVSWANAEGIIGGSNENGTLYLMPQGKATRAQVAAMLMRYVQNIAEQ